MVEYKVSQIIINEIEPLGFPAIGTLAYLNNEEPVIYLCGKSSTGKTTFLNALFNFNKDELYTSTDISTKTEFRFKYGLEEKITSQYGEEIKLSSSNIDRKQVFKSLNTEGTNCEITLNLEPLKGRVIVDIPGVFDFSRNNIFSNQMLDEADIIYFFTPCLGKVNSHEFELLSEISIAGIPIVVLFTMGDITEVDEGITRKTMPNFVKNRLVTCFKDINIAYHQIISSNDFYNRKEGHGIDELHTHILGNGTAYKKIAERNRQKRSVNHYLILIKKRINKLGADSEEFIRLVKRENELHCTTEIKHINDEKYKKTNNVEFKLNMLLKNCEEQIYGVFLDKIFMSPNFPLEDQKAQFELWWNDFWFNLSNDLSEFSISKSVNLPAMEASLFEQVSIDLNKLREITPNKEVLDKKVDSLFREEEKFDSELTFNDFCELAVEIGFNLKNLKIIYKKWSFVESIKKLINEEKNNIKVKMEAVFNERIQKLTTEFNKQIEDSLLENRFKQQIDSLENTLQNLKEINNEF